MTREQDLASLPTASEVGGISPQNRHLAAGEATIGAKREAVQRVNHGTTSVPPPITDVVAPLGPNARAMLKDRPLTRAAIADTMYMIATEPPENHGALRPLSPMPTRLQPSPRPTVLNLIADIAAGIRVLRTYGVEITEAQVMERANNIVAGIAGNYNVTGMGE